ncbi:response regulator transcription factor [uncultured Winogradskyella sp.]|uniref:DNA-binding response regulator n=1 Tax=uncultured Winogradskyella sp. TaxID=395353 RepID=UPI0026263DAC|nr:response regulator transcription factor [uncultured Winogradskyella sp.]
MNPSLIIADDHPLVLKGLKDFLNENSYNVLASAKNGKEALTLIKAHVPDIAILDIQMPFYTGLEIAQKCNEAKLATKIILITFEKDEKIYDEAKNLGVYGYVLKEFALDEIEACIASVINGKPYFSPELINYIEVNRAPEGLKKLSKTEITVFKLIGANKSTPEIAETLNISVRTVEKHKNNIRRKLALDSKSTSLYLSAKENIKFL